MESLTTFQNLHRRGTLPLRFFKHPARCDVASGPIVGTIVIAQRNSMESLTTFPNLHRRGSTLPLRFFKHPGEM
jgi:hypothetical protein